MAKRGRKAKDNKGYLDSNRSNATDYKLIQGNKITMEGVSGNIYAIPLDRQGNAGQGVLMKPGEEHEFEDAFQILEIPETEIPKAQVGLGTNISGSGVFGSLDRSLGGLDYAILNPNSPNYIGRYNTDAPGPGGWRGGVGRFTNWEGGVGRFNPRDTPIAVDRLENTPERLTDTRTEIVNSIFTDFPYENSTDITPQQGPLSNFFVGAEDLGPSIRPQVESVGNITPTNEMSQAWNSEDYSVQNNLPSTDISINQQLDPETTGIEDTERINFNNPYGGVDIPTAANTLGASLSYDGPRTGANTVRGVASGLKLLTGLGRNIMSGYGQNVANQRALEEANRDNRRSAIGSTRSIQGGADLSQTDIDNINNSLGFNLDNNTANRLFTRTPQQQEQNIPQIDFGRYGEVGYFEQGPIQNGRRVIYNTQRNPMNYDDNRRNAIDYLREINGDIFDFQYRPRTENPTQPTTVASRQKGGEVKETDMLTGAYSTGTNNEIPNVEVERGEYIKDNQANKVTEVVGNKHAQGGEKMNLQDHKVLSDYNKIGGAKAKKYRDEYDIKVKAKDTYATVMDKVLQKTGYTKLVGEMEEVIAQTEKERDNDNHQPTSSVNLQFLSGKINDLNVKMQPLEELKSRVFETLFEDQQGDKTQAELNEENQEMQEGGEIVIPNREDENYLETMLQLLEQYPNEFQAHFNIIQEGNNITDIVPVNEETSIQNFRREVTPNITTPQPVQGRMPEENIGGTRNVNLPNQGILPPSAIQPTRMGEITPREAQAQTISPEAQIEEINRQAQTSRREINTLPDSQRRAALAQLNTQTQQAINQVFSQTNRANAQIENQVEQFNTQQANQAQGVNEQMAQQYEQRIVTARDNTETDIRNYFNALNRQNVANYNTVQGLNLINAMYDNVQYDGAGNVINIGRPPTREEMLATAGFYDVVERKEEEETRTTSNRAKRGRKTK